MLWGPYRGVVDLVHDGDTINIKLDIGFDLSVYTRVRVFGINAPELSTPNGMMARAFARQLLPVGAAVRVTSHGWDKYGGRIDGDILFGLSLDIDFATSMVNAGQAAYVTY